MRCTGRSLACEKTQTMDNMNETENQGHPDPEFHSLENKLSALERQIVEQQDQLRDYEKSLVERIGDVDDDRRTTASQLQRAWQSQLEQIDDRLRRHRVAVIGALVLFLVVVGVVLFLVDHKATIDRQLLADELAELKQELAGRSGQPSDADSMRAELSRLSAAVNGISSSPARQDEKQVDRLYADLEGERLARDKADAVIGAEVQRLEAKLEGLMRELGSTREATKTKEATTAASGHQLPDSSTTQEAMQDSAQGSAEASVEAPVESSDTPPAKAVSSPEETPAAAQPPSGDEAGEKVTEASTDAATTPTLVVAEDSYALQLIGFYSLDTLLSFTDRSDLPQRLYYRQETVEGRPWFALIHSLY